MSGKVAKAGVDPIRQRTQYSCMATSMCMCLRALGYDCNEDEVNRVMGATPMRGAAWEHALATAQHYGCRATLTTPATVRQIKEWTDAGKPVMIAWNPEGREWSHASVVFDVDDDLNVHVADPNIPDPDETVRVLPKGDFYKKWYEKWPSYLVRRPALCIEREITEDGKQVMASKTAARIPPPPPPTERTVRDQSGRVWGPKRGLEGPFKYRSGLVLYWDPREGQYYDPTNDMYVESDEVLKAQGVYASAARVASKYAMWDTSDPTDTWYPSTLEMERREQKELERREKQLRQDVTRWIRGNSRGVDPEELLLSVLDHFPALVRGRVDTRNWSNVPEWVKKLVWKNANPYPWGM